MKLSLRSRIFRFAARIAAWLAGAATAFAASQTQVTVLDPTPGSTLLRCTTTGYETRAVDIGGASFAELSLAEEGYLDLVGAPRLPHVCRSVIVPDDQDVRVDVVSARWHDVTGVNVAPARGPISRAEDPAKVRYVFGASYAQDAFFPGVLATAREPYVLREKRGAVIELDVLQYNPVTRTLRVYDELVVQVTSSGAAKSNVLVRDVDRADAEFERIYSHHFVNYVATKAIAFTQTGSMLVIGDATFLPELAPFVAWKQSRGMLVTTVPVSSIGNNATAIKNYVKSVYNAGNLSYVLLVGDAAQVASGSYSGGSSDPFYGQMTTDYYPEVLVGRFSAQNVNDVRTQVRRSIQYEQQNHALAAGGWNGWGMGIASNQGPGHFGEYDNQHMNNIRQDYLTYGYSTVDQIYDPTGTKAMVSNGLNAGRRNINYCGHGSDTSWGSTGYSNNDVAALQNVLRLPVIHSVACVNGNFAAGTCFAEAWLRSNYNGEPVGAAATYMSSINQYWNEPMYAQDESVDLFVAETYWSVMANWTAGSCKMVDLTGSAGVDMLMTWLCFGDPSLRIHGTPPKPPTGYCTSKTTSQGLLPAIGAFGSPSVAAADFHLTCNFAVPQKSGIHFFGGAPLGAPFLGGTLCVQPPHVRGPVTAFDAYGTMVETIALDPKYVGSTLYFQYWGRDPAHPDGTGVMLSDALSIDVVP
ncbi:MAG: C25 family cysteine peptidase [Planctomycetes bacterium]|nr:C25 family cysteine peptidase [Planctomycetota bacterium]